MKGPPMRRLLRSVLPAPVRHAIVAGLAAVTRPAARVPTRDPEAERVLGRKRFAMSYFEKPLAEIESWAPKRTEDTNFYYELTDLNRQHLAHLLAFITGAPLARVLATFRELDQDRPLRDHLQASVGRLGTSEHDIKVAFGRRLGWYAIARLLKPATIVETGVDHGVGSCVMCAALLKNADEGNPGRYFGTELRSEAGQFFTAPYSSVGEILYGDSLQSLSRFDRPIDLFINDSDHSADYEYREYLTIRDKLSPKGVILGDNSHVTDSLPRFCAETGRPFVFFRETPADHWYPGAGIGISCPRSVK